MCSIDKEVGAPISYIINKMCLLSEENITEFKYELILPQNKCGYDHK